MGQSQKDNSGVKSVAAAAVPQPRRIRGGVEQVKHGSSSVKSETAAARSQQPQVSGGDEQGRLQQTNSNDNEDHTVRGGGGGKNTETTVTGAGSEENTMAASTTTAATGDGEGNTTATLAETTANGVDGDKVSGGRDETMGTTTISIDNTAVGGDGSRRERKNTTTNTTPAGGGEKTVTTTDTTTARGDEGHTTPKRRGGVRIHTGGVETVSDGATNAAIPLFNTHPSDPPPAPAPQYDDTPMEDDTVTVTGHKKPTSPGIAEQQSTFDKLMKNNTILNLSALARSLEEQLGLERRVSLPRPKKELAIYCMTLREQQSDKERF